MHYSIYSTYLRSKTCWLLDGLEVWGWGIVPWDLQYPHFPLFFGMIPLMDSGFTGFLAVCLVLAMIYW